MTKTMIEKTTFVEGKKCDRCSAVVPAESRDAYWGSISIFEYDNTSDGKPYSRKEVFDICRKCQKDVKAAVVQAITQGIS